MKTILLLLIACVACFCTSTFAQAEGDECGGSIEAGIGINSFDTTTATSSTPAPDETMCDDTFLNWGTKNPDLWFKFKPTTSGEYSFTTCDPTGFADFDTSIVLYDNGCDNQVACNGDDPLGDSGCQLYYSTITYTLTANNDYFIRIGGWNGYSGQGSLTITDSGGGDNYGACCIDYGNGEYYCYESTSNDCAKEKGTFSKGLTCNEISCGVVALTTWFVNLNNTTPGSGSSWSTAFLDLQDALDVANSGDQIWIAQGTYYPSDTGGSNDTREATYRLLAGVEIYGGFAGNETDVMERLPHVNQVHLSGDLNTDDDGSGDNSENAYHVFIADNLNGSPPILDGLFIRNGNANGSAPHQGGGGMKLINYSVDSTALPLIFKTSFLNNSGKYGGAIAISNQNGGMTFYHCVFANNTATEDGGAIRSKGLTNVYNCLFVGNTAYQSGGAIHLFNGILSLGNSTIVQNRSGYVGGVYVTTGSSISASNCILWGSQDENGVGAQLLLEANAAFELHYNCIQRYEFDLDSVGNTNVNPRFTNEFGNDGVPASGDENYRLFQQSPCIDAGDNSTVTVPNDLVGNARLHDDPYTVDTGNDPTGIGLVVDMGAFEHITGAGGNGAIMWSGANSYNFYDPENWLPGGYPTSDSDVMFNGSPTFQGYVFFDQTSYLNSLHVTEGEFLFDLNNTTLTLQSVSSALRIDPYHNDASVIFQGPGVLDSANPIELGGHVTFENMTLDVDELVLEHGSILNFEGTIIGDVINEGSLMHPGGEGIGVFNIDGNLTQHGNDEEPSSRLAGSIVLDIAGRTFGETYDHLSVTGSVDMSLSLDLHWNREFTPTSGDVFDVLSVGSTYNSPTVIFNMGLPSDLLCRWSAPAAGLVGGGEVTVVTTGPILFETEATHALSTTPNELVVADLDGDGDPDVALAVPASTGGAGSVVVLLNNGVSGNIWQGFTELTPIPVGTTPIDIAVIDIEGDGIADDLVVANYDSASLSILANDGTATFTKTDVTVDTSPKFLAIANYVEDGNILDDIVVACDSLKISVVQNNSAYVGTSFNHLSSIGTPSPADILPGDVNNDKDFDFILLSASADEIRIVNGNGNGTLPPFAHVEQSPLQTGADAAEFVTIDFVTTRDGNMDIITVDEGAGTLSILLGDGSVLGSASTVAVGTNPSEITVHDFDNDGDEDFVVSVIGDVSGERELLIVRNDTEALIVLSVGDATGSGREPTLVDHGDFNSDGVVDLACLIDLGTGVRGLISPAIGIYLNTTEVVVDCPADIDGDGVVAVNDLLAIIAAWGTADAALDLDGSGIVDVGDLLVIIAAWGSC